MRSTLARFGLLLACARISVFCASFAAAQQEIAKRSTQDVEIAKVFDWCTVHSSVTALRVELDSWAYASGNREKIPKRERYYFRWPDAEFDETLELVKSYDANGAPLPPELEVILSHAINASGHFISRFRNQYAKNLEPVSFAEFSRQRFAIQPWVAARFVRDAVGDNFHVTRREHRTVVNLPQDGHNLVFSGEHELSLEAVERIDPPSGIVLERTEFSDYRKVPGLPMKVPFRLARFRKESLDPNLPLASVGEATASVIEAISDPKDAMFDLEIPEDVPPELVRVIPARSIVATEAPSNKNTASSIKSPEVAHNKPVSAAPLPSNVPNTSDRGNSTGTLLRACK